jgi:hypothetical protein
MMNTRRVSVLLFSLFSFGVVACGSGGSGDEAGQGVGTVQSAVKAPDLTDDGCHYVGMYINNQQEPTTVPWWYCVCDTQPTNDPLTWQVAGGWTYPGVHCGNHSTY